LPSAGDPASPAALVGLPFFAVIGHPNAQVFASLRIYPGECR
jgi:hypothetical protein